MGKKFAATCKQCKKPIVGPALKLNDGSMIHESCLSCRTCQTSLKGVPFATGPDQNLYCRPHFEESFAPKCAGCKQVIIGECCKTGPTTSWHPGCLVCSYEGCGESVIGQQFSLGANGLPLCSEHALAVASGGVETTCARCLTAIAPGAPKAEVPIGDKVRTFHSRCLSCVECEEPLAGREVFLEAGASEEGGDSLMCRGCYDDTLKKEGLVCAGCKEIVDPSAGDGLRAGGSVWHARCFCCSACKCDLRDAATGAIFQFHGERVVVSCPIHTAPPSLSHTNVHAV